MKDTKLRQEQVLLVGNNKTIYGLAVCLQKAGHAVLLNTQDHARAEKYITAYSHDIRKWGGNGAAKDGLKIVSGWNFESSAKLSFVMTEEQLEPKREAVARLESMLDPDAVIAVNTESIPLSDIQKGSGNPGRILGMNWVDPVYNTFFLEMICNAATDESVVGWVRDLASNHWGKDPYVIRGELGIRMPLIGALIREAFFLVENGYATIEDIDRACRNDAGYYLPFAGNLRYMDLMGTYAYGMVMKDLNPELATESGLPASFLEMVDRGETGMGAGKGFYGYPDGEGEKWEELLQKFSFEIKELFEKYPFRAVPEEASVSFRN